MTRKIVLAAAAAAILGAGQVDALDNGLARTPPMGWNSWNCFGPNIDENKIKGVADAMASTGLRDAGYIYLNLDDNWMAKSRDGNGNLRADPDRFPGGMKALGDYIHDKGLKFGIYGDRGTVTCYFRDNFKELNTQSGSIGREEQDAKTFASWGVDYLKYDNCEVGYAAPAQTMQQDYETMRDALADCGRDIVFSICAWEFKEWMPEVGNLWRTTTDILNHWKKEGGDWSWGILDIVDLNEKYAPYAKPGAWNDPDMLQVGNFGGNRAPTATEYRSHMSLWCIMAAPIIMGNDIRNMNQTTKDILMNKEVIAVNQDPAGVQGRRIKSSNGLEVWSKPLGSNNSNVKAVALFNRNGSAADITVNFSDIGLSGEVYVRDLWAKADRGAFTGSYTMNVASHETAMLKISGEPPEPVSAFDTVQAENYSIQSGIQDETCGDGGGCIGHIEDGDYVIYSNLTFGEDPTGFEICVSNGNTEGSSIEIRLDSLEGEVVGTCVIPSTGDWASYQVVNCPIEGLSGDHKIVLKFTGADSYLLNINWFRFTKTVMRVSQRNTSFSFGNLDAGATKREIVISPSNAAIPYSVSVFTLGGKLVARREAATGRQSIPMATRGIYLLNVECGNKLERKTVSLF
jgi:alpha-galactosidase